MTKIVSNISALLYGEILSRSYPLLDDYLVENFFTGISIILGAVADCADLANC